MAVEKMADDEEALEKNMNEGDKKNQFQNEDNYDSEEERKKKKLEDEKVKPLLVICIETRGGEGQRQEEASRQGL